MHRKIRNFYPFGECRSAERLPLSSVPLLQDSATRSPANPWFPFHKKGCWVVRLFIFMANTLLSPPSPPLGGNESSEKTLSLYWSGVAHRSPDGFRAGDQGAGRPAGLCRAKADTSSAGEETSALSGLGGRELEFPGASDLYFVGSLREPLKVLGNILPPPQNRCL